MPYTRQTKKSSIPSFRNFIHCGILSCKKSCDQNSLYCMICMKWFHYKCKNISEKKYNEIVAKKLYFICDDHKHSCYSSIQPFSNVAQIDFLTTLMGDGIYRCKKCKKDCLGHGLMDCIQCDVCDKWLHADCASLKYTFDCYINNSLDFICGDKCERLYLSSPLPFYSTFNPDKIEEFHPHREN